MKHFLIGLTVLTSLSSYAQDSGIQKIIEQYRSTLMDLKVGQKSYSKDISTTKYQDDSETVNYTSESESILLKVEGDSYYEYSLTTNSYVDEDGQLQKETSASVTLHDLISNDDVRVLKVENDILHINFLIKEAGFEGEATVIKKLLSPIVCDYTVSMKGTQLDYEFTATNENVCGTVMPAAEIQKLDLKKVEFCDFRKSSTQESCEEEKDMSLLLDPSSK